MDDHLLYLYSTIAQLAAVVAIPFVLTVRADARAWNQPAYPAAVRVIQGVWHLLTIAAIACALFLSIITLAAGYSDETMMWWAINALIVAYSATVLGVIVTQVLTAFLPRAWRAKLSESSLANGEDA
ncbi:MULTISPECIES: hypothetical protein [unclassified Microbacterium]|uniref:hypothetical protein n=1 Tax=unclassified Microbacterium TaxID=2609290 RepID=UPI00342531C0